MPSDKEWRELVEVLGEVAETVTDERVKEIEEEEGNPENPAEDEAKAESKEEETPSEAPDKIYSKADVEQMIKDRLAREKESAKRGEEKARREAAEKAAEENEEYKTLATSRLERVQELEAALAEKETLEEQLSTYRDSVEASVNARMENLNLPAWASELLEEKDPAQKQAFLDKHESDFTSHERVPPADKADETGTPEADEAALAEQAAYTRSNY